MKEDNSEKTMSDQAKGEIQFVPLVLASNFRNQTPPDTKRDQERSTATSSQLAPIWSTIDLDEWYEERKVDEDSLSSEEDLEDKKERDNTLEEDTKPRGSAAGTSSTREPECCKQEKDEDNPVIIEDKEDKKMNLLQEAGRKLKSCICGFSVREFSYNP